MMQVAVNPIEKARKGSLTRAPERAKNAGHGEPTGSVRFKTEAEYSQRDSHYELRRR